MSLAAPDTPIPPKVRALARGTQLTPVWVNGLPDRERLEYYRELWTAT